MKYIQLLLMLSMASLMMAQTDSRGVTYVGHDKVSAAINKGGSLVTAPDYTVTGSHREEPGKVEVHDKETDVIYMVKGDAIFVTGGTVIGLHRTKPGQSLGDDINGGDVHHLTTGDVIVVPAGVPHWFKQVNPTVSYYVVKVIKP